MQATIGDAVSELVQNAFEASAAEVRLEWIRRGARLEVLVRDDGRGMDAATARKALDPLWSEAGKHPGRTVGLGLPFAKQAAEQCGGSFALE